MAPHSKPKTVFMLFMWACLLAGSVLMVLHLFLPSVLQRLLPALIAEKTGIPEVGLGVRRIGFSGADFEAVSAGDKSGPGLAIDTIKIDFSLAGLLKKEIKKIQLTGVRLYVAYPNGNITIPGLFPGLASSGSDDHTAAGSLSASGTGVRISRIEVVNAAAIIKTGDHAMVVPFEFLLSSSPTGMNRLSGELKVYPHGRPLEAKADIDMATGALRLDIDIPWLALDQMPPVSGWIKGIEIQNPGVRANLKSNLTFQPDGIKGKGTLTADLGRLPQYHEPGPLLPPMQLSGDFAVDIPHKGPWSFTMTPLSEEKIRPASSGGLLIGESTLVSGPLVFEVSATGYGSGGQADWKFSTPDLAIQDGSGALVLGPVGFRGTVSWEASAKTPRIALSCLSDPLTLKSEAVHISIPSLSFSGQSEPSDAGPIDESRISGVLDFSKATVFFPSSGTAISGISARLPVCRPCKGLANAGEFSVAGLQWDKKNIGSISGTLRQDSSFLEILGTHRSHLVPGLLVAFSGRFGISADTGVFATLEYKNPSYKPKTPLDLGRFSPEAAGILIAGDFGFSGDFHYGPCGPTGGLIARLAQGSITSDRAGIDIQDMEAKIQFTDLFPFKSAPSQTIHFASAKLGGIQIQKGQIAFQVESFDSLFIEKSEFSWCNGNVDVHALRMKSGVKDYHVNLYGDRLNLAMLLKQFGAANATGKGAVNGKIPIRYINGKLLFENGFLYSTPGQGGTIKVAQTDKLLAEIPKQAAQVIQMDLAREAMKSYDYDWATLGITTEGEDLLLRMELNGKPTHPLPFIYRKETGGFVRIQSGEKGSSFQGITLNINFRLPLDQMLQYRNVLKMFD